MWPPPHALPQQEQSDTLPILNTSPSVQKKPLRGRHASGSEGQVGWALTWPCLSPTHAGPQLPEGTSSVLPSSHSSQQEGLPPTLPQRAQAGRPCRCHASLSRLELSVLSVHVTVCGLGHGALGTGWAEAAVGRERAIHSGLRTELFACTSATGFSLPRGLGSDTPALRHPQVGRVLLPATPRSPPSSPCVGLSGFHTPFGESPPSPLSPLSQGPDSPRARQAQHRATPVGSVRETVGSQTV